MMIVAALLVVLVVAVCAAIWLHHILGGEWLPSDIARERRLSRLTLAELDRRWRDAPDRSEIEINLTTIPSRIGLIDVTLKSLLDQSRLPARIVLNVPDHSIRENRPYEVPAHLRALSFLHVRRCKDWGPATKLIPAVLEGAPDLPILIADDDRIYPPFFVERMEVAARQMPDCALTYAGIVVPPDLTDRPTTLIANLRVTPPVPIRCHRVSRPEPVDILLGVFGYLVRPRFFARDELTDFTVGSPELRYVDDVRTSALCDADRLVIPAPVLSHIPKRDFFSFKRTALGRINRGPGGNERRHNTIGYRFFADRWRVGGNRANRG
ncbi:MAG: hypothetical protein WBF87_17760 [Mesorhizobium sp.]